MSKWQYQTVYMPFGSATVGDSLNNMGADGWELIGIDSGWCVFKRPLTEAKPKPAPKRKAATK